MIKLVHLKEWLREFKRSIYVRRHGVKRYKGDSKQICKQIIDDCYENEKGYFRVSAGHFDLFYSRDFGWVVKSLIELGYKEKVKNTLSYVLNIFKNHGRIRTSINPEGKAFDFPYYSIDSLPYILYSLACLNDQKLVKEYREFLNSEIDFFASNYVTKNGLVVKDKVFSSMKDYSKRKSSCYDNCMLYLLQQSCNKLGLNNPLSKFDYKKILIDYFWTGEYFLDDLSGKKYIAGDANVFPFWVGVINDKKMLKKSVNSIIKNKLDKPFPLKYTNERTHGDFIFIEIIAANYEGNTIWTHMGLLFVDVVGKLDKKMQKEYIKKYTQVIEKHKNFLEVFNPDGAPYKLPYYYTDECMSWCANYLNLLTKKS